LIQRAKRRRVELALRSGERELRGSQAMLRVSYERIRHLSRRLLGEQEAERARIARELHDDINQQLAILSIELDRLRSAQLQVHAAKGVLGARDTVRGFARGVHSLPHGFPPSKLHRRGLAPPTPPLRRALPPPHLPIAFSHRNVPAEIDQNIA